MHSAATHTLAVMSQREPEKGLTDDEKEHLCLVLTRIRDTRFEGNATAMAKALDIGQSQVSQILKGRRTDRSAGIPVLKRIRAFTGLSIDQLIGLPPLKPILEPEPEPIRPPPNTPLSPAEELAYAVIAQGEARRRSESPPRLLSAPPKKGSSDAPRPRRR